MSDKYVIVYPGIGVYCKDAVFRWTKDHRSHEVYPDRVSAERERLRLVGSEVRTEIRCKNSPASPDKEAAHGLMRVGQDDLEVDTWERLLGLSPGLSPDEYDQLVAHESN